MIKRDHKEQLTGTKTQLAGKARSETTGLLSVWRKLPGVPWRRKKGAEKGSGKQSIKCNTLCCPCSGMGTAGPFAGGIGDKRKIRKKRISVSFSFSFLSFSFPLSFSFSFFSGRQAASYAGKSRSSPHRWCYYSPLLFYYVRNAVSKRRKGRRKAGPHFSIMSGMLHTKEKRKKGRRNGQGKHIMTVYVTWQAGFCCSGIPPD